MSQKRNREVITVPVPKPVPRHGVMPTKREEPKKHQRPRREKHKGRDPEVCQQ